MKASSLASIVLCALLPIRASSQQGRVTEGMAGERLPGRVVDVSAGEFFFRSPDSIPAGLTTFRLRQIGDVSTNLEKVRAENLRPATADNDPTRAFHMLWVTRLEEGRTVSEWHATKLKGEPTPWAVAMAGPASVDPPRTSNATMLLTPGTYVLVCQVGSAREDKNRSHLLKGMFRSLIVVPSESPAVDLPRPDVTARITLGGKIQLSGPVRGGRQVIRVINETARSHEFIVARVRQGRSAQEAVAWRRTDGTTHPFDGWGGLSDVPAGATGTTTVGFEMGSYLMWTVRAPATSVTVVITAP